MSYSISDIVFFMIAFTLCYLAGTWTPIDERFLAISSTVFGAFYVHKAQNKWISKNDTSDENTKN